MKKWQNWSKFSDLKFQGSDPIKETHLHQKQSICTFSLDLESIFSHFEPFLAKKWPKMAKISIFFTLIIVIQIFSANLTQTTQN